MAPDVTPIERLEHQPMALDPEAIEAEFARVWQDTSDAGFDESSIRSRVVNLVAVARHDADRERFEEVMGILPERHPCRGILALTDASRTELEAGISAHCWRAVGGGRHVCSEEVLLLGGRQHERQLASAVLALLVPDLSLAVWFTGEASAQGRLAGGLIEEADRIIVDSARSDAVLRLFDTARRIHTEHDIVWDDLAWLRLANWRALIAQLFDDPERAAELGRITRITIEGAPGASEPLLLAGWLAAQLSYTPADVASSAAELRATFYAGSRAVTILISQRSAAPLGSVVMESESARFSVAWHSDSGHMHVQSEATGGPAHRRVVESSPVDDATMISMALDGMAESEVYLRAVEAVAALVG